MHSVSPRAESPEARQLLSSGPSRASHLVVLAACAAIVLAALVLAPSGDFLRLGPWTLPSICTFKRVTDVPCPGCGLTRSIVAAAHGDWSASYGFHRLGPVVLVYLAIQMVYRLTWLAVEPFRAAIARAGRFIDFALIPLVGLLFINWIPILMVRLGAMS